jgi:hypothetical protein
LIIGVHKNIQATEMLGKITGMLSKQLHHHHKKVILLLQLTVVLETVKSTDKYQ